MNLRITSFKFYFIFCVLLFSIKSIQAQMLEEIVNPTNFTANTFVGGEDDELFFQYNRNDGIPNTTPLFKYDGNNLMPIDFTDAGSYLVYATYYNGSHYFRSQDGNTFEKRFSKYDGNVATEIIPPAGYEIIQYIAEYQGLLYLTLFNSSINGYDLYTYDGNNLVEIPTPNNLNIGSELVIKDGLLYLSFFDFNSNNFVYSFDGNDFVELASLPNSLSVIYLTEVGNASYFIFVDGSVNFLLYKLEANTVTEVPKPAGQQYTAGFSDENNFYTVYQNTTNWTYQTYGYDGTNLFPMPSPTGPGFTDPYHVTTIEGVPYFTFSAGFLFRWNGTEFIQVNQPNGFQFVEYGDYMNQLNGEAYFKYLNQSTGKNVLMKLNTVTNEVIPIDNPTTNWSPKKYITTASGQLYITYIDDASNETMFSFDGSNYIEFPNPINYQLGFFLVEDSGTLYFRYDNFSVFDFTVYKIEAVCNIMGSTDVSNVLCSDDNSGEASVSLQMGVPPYNYAWSTGDNTATISNLAAGTYTVTVTDANNCPFIETVTITEPITLTLSAGTQTTTSLNCNGDTNGVAEGIPNGGTSPYLYTWSTGETTATISNLAAGTYSLEVVDANGCLEELSIEITEPDDLIITGIMVTDETAPGQSDGTINLGVEGGTPPYSYSPDISNGLPGGSYNIVVTDANGCIVNLTEIIIGTMVSNENILLEKNIQLFPNPSSGKFYLDFSLPEFMNVWVSIYDVSGKMMMERPTEFIGQQEIEIDISTFNSGMYFIKIQIDEHVFMRRIILQKEK